MTIGTASVEITADASGFGDTASREVSDALDAVVAAAAGTMDGLEAETAGVFDGMGDSASSAASSVEGSMSDAMAGIERETGRSASAAADSLGGIGDAGVDAGSTAARGVSDGVSGMESAASSAAAGVSSSLSGMGGAGVDAGGEISSAAAGAADEMGAISDASKEAADDLADAGDEALGFGDKIKQGLGTVTQGALLGIGAKIGTSVLSGIQGVMAEGWNTALSIDQVSRSLSAMTSETEVAEQMMVDLREVAADRPIDYTSFLEGANTLAYMGFEGQQAIDIMDNVGRAAVGAGNDGDEAMQRVIGALGTMQANGKVTANEIGQISNTGVPMLTALIDHFDMAEGSFEELSAMISDGEVQLDDVMQALEAAGGADFTNLHESFENVNQSLENQIAMLKDEVFTSIGEELQPILNDLDFEGIAESVGELAGHFIEFLPHLVDLALWVGDNLDWILPMAGIISGIAVAVKLLNLAMAANPIGLVVIAIAGLVAGLTYFFTQTELGQEIWGKFMDVLGDAWEWLSGVFTAVWDVIVDAWNGSIEWIGDKITEMGDFFSGLGDAASDALDWVVEKFGEMMDFIGDIPGKIGEFFSDAGSWLVDAGKNLIQGLIDGAQSLLSNIGNFFLDVLPGWIQAPFKAALGIESPSRVFMDYGRNIGEGVVAGVRSMEGEVSAATEGMAGAAASAASGAPVVEMPVSAAAVPSFEMPSGPADGQNAVDMTVDSVDDAAVAMESPAGRIEDMFVSLSDTATKWGADVHAGAVGVAAPSWAAMGASMEAQRVGVIDPMMGRVQSKLSSVAAQFRTDTGNQITPAWQGMADGIQAAKVRSIDPAFAGIESGLSSVVGAFGNGARDVGRHMNDLRRNTEDPVRFTLNTVFADGLVDMWNSVSEMIGTQKMSKRYASFATGGVMDRASYSPGRDNIRMFDPVGGHVLDLSGHEAVMRPEFTRALGTDKINQINAAARTGGVEGVGRYMEHLGAFSQGGIIPGGGYLGGFRPGGVIYGGNYGGLSPITRSHAAWVGRHFPDIFTLTSAWRHTDSGHHSRGEASDWSNGGYAGTREMKALANALYRTFPTAAELIHWPLAGWQNHQHGNALNFGEPTNSQHRNHVHFATLGPIGSDAAGLTSGGPINWSVDWDGMLRGMVADTLAGIDADVAGANFPGTVGQVPTQTWDAVREPALDTMATTMEDYFKSMGDGGGAERWRPLAMQALGRHGYDPNDYIEAMLQQIAIESQGDPTVWNEWDSNWLRGTPSGGLLQVIDPTYRRVRQAYPEAFEGLPDDMLFPLTNLTAGVGAVRMDWGGPAGRWPTRDGYHRGGLAGEGTGWIHKTAEEPEYMMSPVQTQALLDWLDVTPGAQAERVEMMGPGAAAGFAGELLTRLGVRSGGEQARISGPGEGDRGRRIVKVTQHFHGGDSREAARSIIDTLDRL